MVRHRLCGVLTSATVGILLVLAGTILAVKAVSAAPYPQPPYPEGAREYFSDTGHYVKGPFLEFFRTRGGAPLFGYPQTELFYDAQSGLWVQYFDNVRLEWHPQNPDRYKVQLGLLGDLLGHRYPPIPYSEVPRDSLSRHYFEETGHVVSSAFLVFFERYGGLDTFGYPISEPLVENGRIVQYFQRARMEWHSERPPGERVVLGALGLAYMQRFGVPREYRGRQVPPTAGEAVATVPDAPALRVLALVRNVITSREGYQTVTVYVTDSNRQPLEGATATVAVRLPSGTIYHALRPTDARGISSVAFPVTTLPPGQKVLVDVVVSSGELSQTAQTFFVPWY
jgi:hypothetical protein